MKKINVSMYDHLLYLMLNEIFVYHSFHIVLLSHIKYMNIYNTMYDYIH